MLTRRDTMKLVPGGLALTGAAGCAAPTSGGGDVAVDAIVYFYPLITMEMTRRVLTNAAEPNERGAPMGQFHHIRRYPDASFRDVTAPNADTLYSIAWIDVGKEPTILSVPDENGRYYLMPMLDGWTDVFAVPGKRTTGTKAGNYAITGPGWTGTLPKGVTELKSPTSMVWILGRTYSSGTPADYAAVNAIQDKYKVTPLSAWGKPYTPPPGKVDPSVDMKTPVREQVNRMPPVEYFRLASELMKTNPPAAADAPFVAKLAEIGIVPGKDLDTAKLMATPGLADAPKRAQEKIMAQMATLTQVNGWGYTTKTGLYGTDYPMRALITAIGLGANRPQDAIYPVAEKDGSGQKLSGANRYVVRFPKGQLPPVDGFWSITMYDEAYFFVPNKLNRYTVSSRFPFRYNPDGSLDLYVQQADPGGAKTANWLPAPEGNFILMLRMYWPKEKPPSIIDGTWKIPPVEKVS